ncbi:CO dehydrogenase/acetyl-CoA synthase gamma subunit (corrinoid Fe-S protein) [Methanolobus tindarius DSM 2278]|uniref:CO dehydrogenase/acetyl-CoA synthase gamma subunit (Corrinoid Fe-S protein) n=1 Tax=Methanolobus tindarius DSM 2278 TaxID=1090322 RepID=W9DU86_METTI|nr:mercury methylation corrinoid protein HgcA [Methanolobus tindarius]ETA69368.1 CO dehydrogenase/acetyl-CoA synthase gamma subunit (corrinoid Fe-S protein) [Methanolobus tindarius DSM 2278]
MDKTRDTDSRYSPESKDDAGQFIQTISLEKSSPAPEIRETTSLITFNDRLDHFLAHWGVNRMKHRIDPGIYKLGNPDADSPVFVSANYTLSFDALRSSLTGIDCYILVIDTKGINVWCAAGKGTFGTDEIVYRIRLTGLAKLVNHRNLILPQLGAPGVSAHEVKRRSGFKVEYGPVRAKDLPEYLNNHIATPEMRKVRFTFKDRLVLTPIEFIHVIKPTLIAAIILYLLSGPFAALLAIVTAFAGTVLFPVLLPYLPTHDLSIKGILFGWIVALPFGIFLAANTNMILWKEILSLLAIFLIVPAITSYLALNFTGCTTYTSRTGVKKEIFKYVPYMALKSGTGLLCLLILAIANLKEMI